MFRSTVIFKDLGSLSNTQHLRPGKHCRLIACTACAASVIKDPVQGYKKGDRYFYFPGDDDNTLHLVDADEPADLAFIEEYTKNPANYAYWLYTRNNPNVAEILMVGNSDSVLNSNFSFSKITVILAHGWNAFLENAAVNVLDWSALANRSYTTAKEGTADVGRGLGQFVNWLAGYGLAYSRVHLVGFSLGGHLVGNAGRETGSRVHRVTALDPAGPLWGLDRNRIAPTDARYVEVIHTETTFFGYKGLCGDADFYPNGGSNMPGCTIIGTSCSHHRSYKYMASSVKYNRLIANECGSINDANKDRCTGARNSMGNSDINKSRVGIFRVNTRRNYPF